MFFIPTDPTSQPSLPEQQQINLVWPKYRPLYHGNLVFFPEVKLTGTGLDGHRRQKVGHGLPTFPPTALDKGSSSSHPLSAEDVASYS